MKLKLKAILTMVTMMFCFSSPAFAERCIATTTCTNEAQAQKIAFDYETSGCRVEIRQISHGHYEVHAYDPNYDIPKLDASVFMHTPQYVETYSFDTPEKAGAFVKKMHREGMDACKDYEYDHNTEKWIYRVRVYA